MHWVAAGAVDDAYIHCHTDVFIYIYIFVDVRRICIEYCTPYAIQTLRIKLLRRQLHSTLRGLMGN